MRVWVEDALALLERESRVALVSVVGVAGSAPREAGTKMLVSAGGAIGTIGGGALEHTCIAQARAMLDREGEHARAQDYPLGPLLGQCCGGHVRIAVDVLTAADRVWLTQAAAYERDGAAYSLCMPLRGARGARAGWREDAEGPGVVLRNEGGAAVAGREAWSGRIEFVRPRARNILLVGGGHVGAALAGLLQHLPVRLTWVDTRPGETQEAAAFGGATLVADPARAVAQAPPDAAVLIMTHSHALDFDLVAAALRRDDIIYCGVIGSKTKRQRFLSRLAQAGFAEAQRARLVCPIGAVGLAGKEPGVIALAVAMEIMQRFEAREQTA